MAVYSMTGYASAQKSAASASAKAAAGTASPMRIGIEIRSVNSRFLDLSFRLPEDLRQHEPVLRELLGAKLRRGKVELRASLESEGTSALPRPSASLLQELAALQEEIQQRLPGAQTLGVADVMRLCASEQASQGGATAHADEIVAITKDALGELMASREREGARLAAMLSGHLAQLQQLALQAVPMVPALVEQQRKRFLARWQEAMALGQNALPEAALDRAHAEATAFAIRIDVAEEIIRVQSHLEEIGSLVAKGGSIGKRLDFIIQELHREANTLGSKSAALEMTRVSVDMKVLIEQMREQVQNIE